MRYGWHGACPSVCRLTLFADEEFRRIAVASFDRFWQFDDETGAAAFAIFVPELAAGIGDDLPRQ